VDNLFTIHNVKIKVKEIGKPFYLIPFGDVHRYASQCDVERWIEFVDWAKKKENCYFLGMGDYDDLASFTERRILNSDDLHESTTETLEDLYNNRIRRFYHEISFMKGKVIGLIEGNHYAVYQTGMTTTQELCRLLECKYLGISSFIRLSFEYGNKGASIDIWAHHGKGAAKLVGGSINQVEQMSLLAEADIYLAGHDHKKTVALRTKLKLAGNRNLKLSHRKIVIARTGAFLKGYVPDSSSYVARALLNPTDIGVIQIIMTPKRKVKQENLKNLEDTFYVELNASL
jgi:hypothetical protein